MLRFPTQRKNYLLTAISAHKKQSKRLPLPQIQRTSTHRARQHMPTTQKAVLKILGPEDRPRRKAQPDYIAENLGKRTKPKTLSISQQNRPPSPLPALQPTHTARRPACAERAPTAPVMRQAARHSALSATQRPAALTRRRTHCPGARLRSRPDPHAHAAQARGRPVQRLRGRFSERGSTFEGFDGGSNACSNFRLSVSLRFLIPAHDSGTKETAAAMHYW